MTFQLYGSCLRDDGGPIGIGFQKPVSNQPQAALIKHHGRERWGQGAGNTCAGKCQRDERKQTNR